MPDHLSKVHYYRERATECRRLACLAAPADARAEYQELAKNYEELARAEISVANAAPISDVI